MTQQQKREKAAELLGWKREESPFTRHGLTITTVTNRVWWHPDIAGCSSMEPLYDEDLNLMFQAEEVLTAKQWKSYLARIISPLAWMSDGVSQAAIRVAAHATAAQRLDAWLEVMMEGES